MPPAHVLVVEDDARLRGLVREALEATGHRVTAVGTGSDALLRALEGGIDLVLLDLNLPDVDGIEVARRLADGRCRSSCSPPAATSRAASRASTPARQTT
jgi:CheY-like chemotaxis protein